MDTMLAVVVLFILFSKERNAENCCPIRSGRIPIVFPITYWFRYFRTSGSVVKILSHPNMTART